MPTAGILVIGNEILSGKVVDSNSPYLCEQLRELGVDVERIVTIPDVIETIASEVKSLSLRPIARSMRSAMPSLCSTGRPNAAATPSIVRSSCVGPMPPDVNTKS